MSLGGQIDDPDDPMVTLFVNILEANPFIRVACRDADLEVGHGRACKPGPVEFFDSMEDGRGAKSKLLGVALASSPPVPLP